MLMEFAQGQSIIEWAQGDLQKEQARAVAKTILQQCFVLDRAGLDHGELAHLDRHIIVDGARATIIDFESASTTRRPSNVSSAGQSLFVSGAIANALAKILPHDRDAAIDALRKYKRDQTQQSLEGVLALAC